MLFKVHLKNPGNLLLTQKYKPYGHLILDKYHNFDITSYMQTTLVMFFSYHDYTSEQH